jgi:secreted trypsin-like serine protease
MSARLPGIVLAVCASWCFVGIADASQGDRIVGGTPTRIQSAPWQVAVDASPTIYTGSGHDRLICGGTLVSPTLVVTAAHCMYLVQTGAFTSADKLSVISGRTTLSSAEGTETQVDDYRLITDAQGQPLYNPVNQAWDVALLRLAQPATGTPILLAGPDERELWSVGRPIQVSGWGRTAFGGESVDGLLATEVAVQPDSVCVAGYPRAFSPETQFCAGLQKGGHDICQGDSGGPAVAATAAGGVRLVGDSSYSHDGSCGSAAYPGVHGRIAEDPMRRALQAAASSLTGETIVGTGATAPTALTAGQAKENAAIYVRLDCSQKRGCSSAKTGACAASGSGYTCKVTERVRKGRTTVDCARKVSVSAASGTLTRTPLKRFKCR